MPGIGVDFADLSAADLAAGDHDVVGLRAAKFVNPQFGFPPGDPVVALGIAAIEWMRVRLYLARRNGQMPRLVIHSIKRLILEHAVIATAGSLPGSVVDQRHFLRFWMMEFDRCFAVEALDQEIVDEKLAPSANVDRRRGVRRSRRCRQPMNCYCHSGSSGQEATARDGNPARHWYSREKKAGYESSL